MSGKNRSTKKLTKQHQDELDAYLELNEKIEVKFDIKNLKYRKKFKNKKQKDLYETILKNRIIFIKGPAGTGKTIVSLMACLECLISDEYNIGKISLTKPIVEVSKSLGALPGDEKEKTALYFAHFYDNLEKLLDPAFAKALRKTGLIQETILNYVRGNTFGTYDMNGNPIGHICILDEAQNTTTTEIKTFISRMGEDSKLIICGDIDQVDIQLKSNQENGFTYAWNRLQNLENIAFFEFTEDDIVREKLLIEIMKRFKN